MRQQDPVSKLVFELSKLPGIGEKTATRLAYFILKQDTSYAQSLSESVLNAKTKIALCSNCQTFTDTDPCRICSDHTRVPALICVVEKPSDVFSIEQSSRFPGLYHVLHGTLSPLDGIGPEDLKITELLKRLETMPASSEVLLALNPSVEGEATTLYLTKLLKMLPGIKITRLAYGIPMGGRLEFTDKQTINKAIENRMEIKSQ